MKFLIRSLGFAVWRAEFEKALALVRDEGGVPLSLDAERPPIETAPDWSRPVPPSVAESARRAASAEVRGPGIVPAVGTPLPVLSGGFLEWQATNVRRQKQDGYALVTVTVPLGDLTGAQLRVIADLALAYGDGTVRVTADQDLLFRWVRAGDVPELYRRLAAVRLGLGGAGSLADVTSCPGAEACRLAVTQSRGLGKLLGDHLRERPDLVAAVPGLDIKISGCPNGCGQHHIAGLGFQGSVRKVGDKAVPQYFVMLGGGVDGGRASFGRIAAKVPGPPHPRGGRPAGRPLHGRRRAGETARSFFRRLEVPRVKALLADLEALSPETATPADFIDLGEEAEFVVETQEGECVA